MAPERASAEVIPELVVTSSRWAEDGKTHIGNISAVDQTEIRDIGHAHIHELLSRLAGVWISRGSGQENLSSIRSPVLTGAGSCAAFLTLENGIPSRPSGFCNVNQLFELNTELAESIEVTRGPGKALYGSNALHGTVNVLLPQPDANADRYLAAQLGSNDYFRLDAGLASSASATWIGGFTIADDGGFRKDSGYRQIKAYVTHRSSIFGGELSATVSVSDLDQETAGFILGEDAYKDPLLRLENLNPEAFRQADSQRLYAIWNRSFDNYEVDVRPYVRRSEMTFLQHFLPGQPLEENGHVSSGVMFSASTDKQNRSTVFGLDLGWADVYLRETQFGPTSGSAFLQETRPSGKHYDYDVTSIVMAPFVQVEWALSDKLLMSAGLRGEYISYKYRNNMSVGNARDDGTLCGFGGCLYTRPADRRDEFTNIVPKLGFVFSVSDNLSIYGNLAQGFRAPQMTELYRLQSGQLISDLKSESMDSLEFGMRFGGENWQLDSSLFAMRKKNSVFRDSEGFNVSGARSKHRGIEVALELSTQERWLFRINGTYARHQYDFDAVAQRGEAFVSGRDIDTAPRWHGDVELRFLASESADVSLSWVAIGDYYLDAENRFEYPGHTLLNLRGRVEIRGDFSIAAHIKNLGDERLADRADYAFGNYRYFPGRGREYFVHLRYGY